MEFQNRSAGNRLSNLQHGLDHFRKDLWWKIPMWNMWLVTDLLHTIEAPSITVRSVTAWFWAFFKRGTSVQVSDLATYFCGIACFGKLKKPALCNCILCKQAQSDSFQCVRFFPDCGFCCHEKCLNLITRTCARVKVRGRLEVFCASVLVSLSTSREAVWFEIFIGSRVSVLHSVHLPTKRPWIPELQMLRMPRADIVQWAQNSHLKRSLYSRSCLREM